MAKRAPKKAGLWSPTGDEQVVVLQGPDAFLRSEYAAAIKKLHEEREGGEIDVLRFDGQSASAADVLDECRSFGLMQQHKIVLVDQADQLVKEGSRPLLERYAAAPSEAATLVLRADKWNRGKLDDLIKKVGAIVRCEPLPRAEAVKWITARAKGSHEARIEPDAAGALHDRMAGDLGRIDTELAKLAVMVMDPGASDAPPTITLETVLAQTGLKGLDDPWSIQGPLLSGDAGRAAGHLRRLLEENAKDLIIPISWAMVDLAGQIHRASRLISTGTAPGAVGGRLKLWPPEKAQAIGRIAASVKPTQSLAFYRECVANDRALKSGLGIPAQRVERLALAFASLGR